MGSQRVGNDWATELNWTEGIQTKKVCSFFLLENSRPLSPWGPPDFLSTCLRIDSLIVIIISKTIVSCMVKTEKRTLYLEKYQCLKSMIYIEVSSRVVWQLCRIPEEWQEMKPDCKWFYELIEGVWTQILKVYVVVTEECYLEEKQSGIYFLKVSSIH